jgi:hypothetical protein
MDKSQSCVVKAQDFVDESQSFVDKTQSRVDQSHTQVDGLLTLNSARGRVDQSKRESEHAVGRLPGNTQTLRLLFDMRAVRTVEMHRSSQSRLQATFINVENHPLEFFTDRQEQSGVFQVDLEWFNRPV